MKNGGIWAVIGLVGVVALLSWLKAGKLDEGKLLAILAILVVGAIFPPLAIGLLCVAILWIAFTGGAQELFGWVGNLGLVTGSGNATHDRTYDTLGPTLPGYTYSPGLWDPGSKIGTIVP